ncbi:MAG TPA: D-alanyl-D-alanine carboxypeptidase/D-alanyl-D-alanine-endopeptidase [Bdellovibrionota bacterium]|jgi:D-alanyl-D-alanine carboxypeptidase/D-alanyl-D-alanine-endopeptidase (penicillin-binding protein 4)
MQTLLWYALLLPLSASATDWQALLDQNDGARVHFGVALGGADSYERNSDEAFAPASNSKLFTAGALLEALGADYRYPTKLRWTEPSPGTAAGLTIIGAGDPSWGLSELGEGLTDRLTTIAQRLKESGIHTVEGAPRAVAADARWNKIEIPEGWKSDDTSSCMGALGQAFNLNVNCSTYKVNNARSGSWQGAGISFPVVLRLREGSSTSVSARLASLEGSWAYLVEGSFRTGGAPVSLSLPVYDTKPWVAALFQRALEAKGIRIQPAREAGGESKELVFHSAPLSTLLKPFLKNSINVMGDSFLKTLGSRTEGGASLLQNGLAAMKSFLLRKGAAPGFVLNDGSGLSRTSRVTPASMFRVLQNMRGEKYFPALWGALPIAGVDGTLSNRMKGTPAAGVLRAKTGTLNGVYNLAGYVPTGNGYLPFVILTRTSPELRGAARAAEDRVGARLAGIHGVPVAGSEEPFPYVPEHAGLDAQ